MIFPQDQLGHLVRSHIEEQTRRYDSTEDILRQRRAELRDAELQSVGAPSYARPVAPADALHAQNNVMDVQQGEQRWGCSRASSTQSIAQYAVQRGLSTSSSVGGIHQPQIGSGGMRSVGSLGPAEHRAISPTRREPSPPTVPPSGLAPPPKMHYVGSVHDDGGDGVAAPVGLIAHNNTYEAHRALSSAIEGSPVILSLQHAILRLEDRLALSCEQQAQADARVLKLEDEKETMRLEIQTLSELCVRHTSMLAEMRQALLHGGGRQRPLSPPSSASRSQSSFADGGSQKATGTTDVQEAQALLSTALQEDTSTAAALIGIRSSGSNNRKETVCDQCFSRAVCTSCGNCGSEWYCSANCALLRRDKHRAACDMLRGMKKA